MRNYRTQTKQAIGQPFTLKKIDLQKFSCTIGSPPIVQKPTPRPSSHYRDILVALAIGIALAILYISQKPRLDAYNECYMQNYQKWGSCPNLGGGEYR